MKLGRMAAFAGGAPTHRRFVLAAALIVVGVGAHLVCARVHSAPAPSCIVIRTVAQLNMMRSNLAGHYCLANDINLASIPKFIPIGTAHHPFTGRLDGQGHSIKGLKITQTPSEYDAGLFGVINRGTVRNLQILGAVISAHNIAGVLASQSTGARIENVHVRQGRVSGRYAGGLVGNNDGSIVRSSAEAFVRGESAGALAGRNTSNGLISECSASGKVSQGEYIGGLVGANNGRIEKSRADTVVQNPLVWAGGLVGDNAGVIVASHASGRVSQTLGANDQYLGGLAGTNRGLILRSYASGAVSGGHIAGGLVGFNWAGNGIWSPEIRLSYATGSVTVKGEHIAGGLVGFNDGGIIRLSQAVGPVTGTGFSIGGLVGLDEGGTEVDSLALGRVVTSGAPQLGMGYGAGGLLGVSSSTVLRSYAAGFTQASGGLETGGLTAIGYGTYSAVSSVWDGDTTHQDVSDGGARKTTFELQSRLPPSFGKTTWGITPGVSYPYLLASTDFHAPLATVVFNSKLFTFLPMSQSDALNYADPPLHSYGASLAAVFTMIGRAIGITNQVPALRLVAIDKYFWDDSSRLASWSGPVTLHATLSPPSNRAPTSIAASTPIAEDNVVGPIRSRSVVLIRGSYSARTGVRSHWMLATSFVTNANGDVTALVANDPWTGAQVRIDPTTKKVVDPAFPLTGFTVNAFRIVRLN